MRLDHLLSKEKSRGYVCCLVFGRGLEKDSGVDAFGGNTRKHTEHEG